MKILLGCLFLLGAASLTGATPVNPFETPGELFSTEKPIELPSARGRRTQPEKSPEGPRQGLTNDGLGGLLHTATTDRFPSHRLLFGSSYTYTPWNYRFDEKYSTSEQGILQTWRFSAMYPTDNGELAVTVPYHYYELSAPRLTGLPAHEHSGLGDVKLAAKGTWFPPQRFYRFGCGVVVDFPTGDKRYLRPAGCNDEESVFFFGNVSTKESEDLRAHAQLGYAFNEDTFEVWHYNLAIDYSMAERVIFLFELVGSEGPKGYGSNLDAVPGVRVALSDTFSGTLSTAFAINSGREFGYDYTLQMNAVVRW